MSASFNHRQYLESKNLPVCEMKGVSAIVFITGETSAAGEKEQADRKAKAKAEKAAWHHDFAIGDILHYSWGYEQTNCEFYQVVSLKAKAIMVRRISGAMVPDSGCGPMSGSMTA